MGEATTNNLHSEEISEVKSTVPVRGASLISNTQEKEHLEQTEPLEQASSNTQQTTIHKPEIIETEITKYTLKDQLIDVRRAIKKLISTNIASYKIGEQEINKNRLRDLQARERYLIEQIQDLGADYDPLHSGPIAKKTLISFER